MAEYAGSACVIQWIQNRTGAPGTLDLSAHTRSVTVESTQETIDATAGQDANLNFLTSFVDWTVTWNGVAQNNAASLGTSIGSALQPGVAGTVVVEPFGTAVGGEKYTLPAFVSSSSHEFPYDDVAVLTAEWKPSAGQTMTYGTTTA